MAERDYKAINKKMRSLTPEGAAGLAAALNANYMGNNKLAAKKAAPKKKKSS